MSHRTRNPEGLATGPEYRRTSKALLEVEHALSRLASAAFELTDGDDISPVSEEIAEQLDDLREDILDGQHTRLRHRLYGIDDDPYTSGSEEDEDGEEKRRPNPPVVQDALDAQRRREVL